MGLWVPTPGRGTECRRPDWARGSGCDRMPGDGESGLARSLVSLEFVRAVPLDLQLKGRVVDVEVLGDTCL